MSLAGGGAGGGSCTVMSYIWGLWQGALYGEVQCIMGNDQMGPPYEQTDMTENTALQQIRWRLVINRNTDLVSISNKTPANAFAIPWAPPVTMEAFPAMSHVT